MSAWEKAIDFVLEQEGGYVDDPRDPGGETNYGISKRSHPEVNIKELTRKKAVEIYSNEYWKPLELNDLPEAVAIALFDTSVNLGQKRGVKFLQETYNELVRGDSLRVDGVLGPVTSFAVTNWCGESWTCRSYLLASRLLNKRTAYYGRITRRDSMRPFLRGWLLRVTDLNDLICGGAGWPVA